MTEQWTTADVARILESAKNEHQLKVLVAEIREQGKQIFGDGFNIHLDETMMSKNFRNRVFIQTA